MIDWLLVPLAYLLGSVSSAVIVCRVMGFPDPRGQGSGNPGATNVMRIGGKKAAAITLVGDALKGLIPVLLVHAVGGSELLLAVVMLAAFLGHLYPVFFGFKGGKGVATALGLSLGVYWLLGVAILSTWLLVYKLKKISSLSALVAAVLAPVYAWFLLGSPIMVVTFGILAVLLLWRHQRNIKNLLEGNES
ncbi:MAG: glycerol-3-phosphate 1-O-acyltransferase PlsY [Methylococcales bacterium]